MNTDALVDFVIALHLAFFVFVVAGFIATVLGIWKQREWVRVAWFRILHLVAVLSVLLEDTFGWECPLNVAEANLRASASGASDPSSYGVLNFLLHHTISEGMLDIMYWTMGAVLMILLFVAPPATFYGRVESDYDS